MTEVPSTTLFGVNLPWLFGSYGHDMAPNEMHPDWGDRFDAMKAIRPLVEARELGFRAARVWLCEKGEGIVTRDGAIEGVHPRLFEAIETLQASARTVGLGLYWTLLDANAWAREGDRLTGEIVRDPAQRTRFAERVAAPIARALDPRLTFGLEVINEPEALTASAVPAGHEAIEWDAVGALVREVGAAVRAERPGTMITAGTLPEYLRELLAARPTVDAIDVHAYHLSGGLPSREQLARESGDAGLLDPSMALIVGECGMPDGAPDEAMNDLQNYLYNAQSLGYAAAFLWRLERVLIDPKDKHRAVTPTGYAIAHRLRERTHPNDR